MSRFEFQAASPPSPDNGAIGPSPDMAQSGRRPTWRETSAAPVCFLAGGDPQDADGVADRVGGALPAFRSGGV
ncbi:MAG: hypothetical protein AB7J30_20235 [Hyphomicrobium sp.]|uniref:hypothetical protein n=1 Tax=Hyphomicrobium sp. TaxID=82 RepID=UPI003D106964